jgi:hypothetical protein
MKLALAPIFATLIVTASGCAEPDLVELSGSTVVQYGDTVEYVLSMTEEHVYEPGPFCSYNSDKQACDTKTTYPAVEFEVDEVSCAPGCDATFEGRSVFVTGHQLGDAKLTIEYSKKRASPNARYTRQYVQRLRFVQADALAIQTPGLQAEVVEAGRPVQVCAELLSEGAQVEHEGGVFGIVGVPTTIEPVKNDTSCKVLSPLEPGQMTVEYTYKGLKRAKTLSVRWGT